MNSVKTIYIFIWFLIYSDESKICHYEILQLKREIKNIINFFI
jgi:hypothetical protein